MTPNSTGGFASLGGAELAAVLIKAGACGVVGLARFAAGAAEGDSDLTLTRLI